MREKRYYVCFDSLDRGTMINCLNKIRNRLIQDGKYTELKMFGKLNNYLADVNDEAEKMFNRMVVQMTKRQGITEKLKAENPMIWVQQINNIQNSIREIIYSEFICI